MQLLIFLLSSLSLAVAAPAPTPAVVDERATAPTVVISSPSATIVGLAGDVEQFPGIPFAQAPTGTLRLKPPQAITSALGTYSATANGPACPQMLLSTDAAADSNIVVEAEVALLLDTPLFQTATDQSEDCLYLNVHRPAGTNSTSKLPVLFWIFGGGFEIGWNSMYDGAGWVSESVSEDKPIIFVSVNYRVGGFGFLPGKEILEDGSANLGLLDQRLGLEWVADNIEAFGGDPDKVTIWGESAGAISVMDQMLLYDGDYTYNGNPLFRGGIMNSGSVVPVEAVDGSKGQAVYDHVVEEAGCSNSSDTLECLRDTDYETLLDAMNSVPGILGYDSVALSYLPRPDGTAITASPEILVAEGKYAPVPFIIGDQEDEGTIFALFQSNITTTEEMAEYFTSIFFQNATIEQMEELIALYPTISDGSPFRTGILNDWYTEYKVLAAILGDLTFTITRRVFLETANSVYPDVPSWSYLSSYDYGTPILGTFHGSDLLQVFFGVLPDYASEAFHQYYLSFVTNLDPNNGTSSSYAEWPRWSDSNELVNMYPTFSTLITDDFRSDVYDWLVDNIDSLHV